MLAVLVDWSLCGVLYPNLSSRGSLPSHLPLPGLAEGPVVRGGRGAGPGVE